MSAQFPLPHSLADSESIYTTNGTWTSANYNTSEVLAALAHTFHIYARLHQLVGPIHTTSKTHTSRGYDCRTFFFVVLVCAFHICARLHQLSGPVDTTAKPTLTDQVPTVERFSGPSWRFPYPHKASPTLEANPLCQRNPYQQRLQLSDIFWRS